MHKMIRPFVAVLLLSVSQLASAQVLTYFDCDVENVRGFRGALTGFYNTLSGGQRPLVFLDAWAYGDGSLGSHRVIAAYPDYQAMADFGARIRQSPEAQAAVRTIGSVADCEGPGISVLRGSWGNQEAQGNFFAVYHIAARDGAAYSAALSELAESQSANAPGQLLLFENRAGLSGVSHIVVISAPNEVVLNQFLDQLFASDDFEDFIDEVGDTRTVVNSSQVARIMVLSPDGN
jgi:hypothetical protein